MQPSPSFDVLVWVTPRARPVPGPGNFSIGLPHPGACLKAARCIARRRNPGLAILMHRHPGGGSMRFLITALAAAWVAPVQAADIVAALTIDKVTVYRDSAIVTRSGRVEIPAGEHRLIVRGLSDRVDPATLRLSAASSGLKLAGVEVQRIV